MSSVKMILSLQVEQVLFQSGTPCICFPFVCCCSQCKPYHHSDKALIIGDAAHAMVPFYAQGMNSVSVSF